MLTKIIKSQGLFAQMLDAFCCIAHYSRNMFCLEWYIGKKLVWELGLGLKTVQILTF
jgi:hypothetical protein